MNTIQLELIKQEMDKLNITNYSTRIGNNCIIVNYNKTECYYLFNKDNQLINVVFD